MSLVEKMKGCRLNTVKADKFIIDLDMPKSYPPIKARKTEEGGVRDRFMAAKAELPDEIKVIRPFDVNGFEKSNANTIYVAEDGCDCNCGCKDKPVATIAEALERAKGKGGAKIVLKDGCYNIHKTVVIGKEHSGTVESPLIITAENEGCAFVSSAHRLSADMFRRADDEAMLARLQDDARKNVLVADVSHIDLSRACDGYFAPHLVINGVTMNVARYPNTTGDMPLDWADRKNVPLDGAVEGVEDGAWEFYPKDDRIFSWQDSDDIWIRNNFSVEYHHEHCKAEINKEKRTVKGEFIRHKDATLEVNEATRYYLYNVFEELDAPGEWFLDKKNSKLYLYPPKGGLGKDDVIHLVVELCDLILCDGAENVIFNGIDIGRNKGFAIETRDCRQVLIQNCRISNVEGNPNLTNRQRETVHLCGGFRNGIIASRFEYCAVEVGLCGGDEDNLIPANNFMQNCVIDNQLLRFGAYINGCGIVFSHNYVHNTTFCDRGSNESIVEYNVFEGSDTEAMDSGTVYIQGYPPNAVCGNHYRYNYLFAPCRSDYGIYFDDMSRGMYAYGNIVVGNGANPGREDKYGKWWPSGGRSFNRHNGREHCYYNNISIDAGFFAFGGDLSYWLAPFEDWKKWCDGMLSGSFVKRNEVYLGRNPGYRELCELLDKWGEDTKDPDYVEKSGEAERKIRLPWYNHIENNLIVRADSPYKLDGCEEFTTGLDTNFIINEDPGFVDEKNRNYALKPDSQVFEKIPGFEAPPFEKMGLVNDPV